MRKDENRIVVDCAFRFNCPRDWNALATTSNDRVRFCDTCQRDVHYCGNEEEYLSHAAAGHCVAVLAHSDTEEGVVTIGEPDVDALKNWRRRFERGAGKNDRFEIAKGDIDRSKPVGRKWSR